MGPHIFDKNKKIPSSQVLWQVFEVVMNIWILITILTVGISPLLIVWTVFEVIMNAWILVTMVKIGIKFLPSKR